MRSILCITIIVSLSICLVVSGINAGDVNSTMTVEVDLIGFNSSSSGGEISIEVPDFIDLGNVSKTDLVSKEVKVSINNTGTTAVSIIPIVYDPDEEIFKWLFFRTRQRADNESLNIFYKLRDYELSLNKPSPGRKIKEYCYMQLNLTNFDGQIREDVIDYQADIIFLAIPR